MMALIVLVVGGELGLREGLEPAGMFVIETPTAEDALRILDNIQVDAVVSTQHLDGMGGVDLYQQLPSDLQRRFVLRAGGEIEALPVEVPVISGSEPAERVLEVVVGVVEG